MGPEAAEVRLYYFPVAPNPTKVRLYLAEKAAGGAAIELEEVLVDYRKGEQKGPEHLARNPFARLPVLELDDGAFLTESLAIMLFLEELHPDPDLIGGDPLERARVREMERICELDVLLPLARVVHATRSPLGHAPSPEVADFFGKRLARSLAILDERLADGRPFVAGERPTIADCTLAAAFQFARFGGLPLDPGLKRLARWDGAFRDRPSARSVLTL